jgi:hypothetical protein
MVRSGSMSHLVCFVHDTQGVIALHSLVGDVCKFVPTFDQFFAPQCGQGKRGTIAWTE